MNPFEWLKREGSLDLASVTLSVITTFFLSVVIAWLHRRTYRGGAYTQDYAHTLVIISVVTTVLISVVSGSAAIGVAMFAAFSVIRFPRSLGQSSDLAFAFFAIAMGMVCGSGRHLTAIFITALMGGVVLILFYRNVFAPAKATHLLTVSLASDADFEGILAPVFAVHADSSRLLRLIPSPDGDRTEVRYGLQLKPDCSTPVFIEALHDACGNRRIMLMPANQEFDIER